MGLNDQPPSEGEAYTPEQQQAADELEVAVRAAAERYEGLSWFEKGEMRKAQRLGWVVAQTGRSREDVLARLPELAPASPPSPPVEVTRGEVEAALYTLQEAVTATQGTKEDADRRVAFKALAALLNLTKPSTMGHGDPAALAHVLIKALGRGEVVDAEMVRRVLAFVQAERPKATAEDHAWAAAVAECVLLNPTKQEGTARMTESPPMTPTADDLAKARTALGTWLGFSASVIKSGEPWTTTCERDHRAAAQGLTTLIAALEAREGEATAMRAMLNKAADQFAFLADEEAKPKRRGSLPGATHHMWALACAKAAAPPSAAEGGES